MSPTLKAVLLSAVAFTGISVVAAPVTSVDVTSADATSVDATSSETKPRARADQDPTYRQLELFAHIFDIIRNEYVDTVEDEEVVEAAVQGMLRSLDPHSNYFNRDSYEDVQTQMKGEYGGLGIEVTWDKSMVKVVAPIDETPAFRAGIKGGDYISHIDGVDLTGGSLDDAISKMRGPAGEDITITVLREGETGPLDITMTRENIRVKSVRQRVEADSIGYIRVSTFNQTSGEGVEEAIIELREELGSDLDGYILDLRSNPGGLLIEAQRITDAFLESGEIVSTRARRNWNNSRLYAKPGDLAEGAPVIVLVNNYSASASEIVAGALQDHRRAIVLGEQTFGKGTVQTEIPLGRQGDHAIRLTTARYYTPSGKSIQGRGIEPDIEVLTPRPIEAQRIRLRREENLSNTITNDQDDIDHTGEDDSAKIPSEPMLNEDGTYVDVQLNHAIRLLKALDEAPQSTTASLGRQQA